jgi:hypothetical protein
MDVSEHGPEVVDMSQHVVARDEIGVAVPVDYFADDVVIEEGIDGFDAIVVRNSRRQGSGINAANTISPIPKRLEAGPVVRPHVHDQGLAGELTLLLGPPGICLEMLDEAGADAAQIGVICGIEQFRRYGMPQLEMRADAAAHQIKPVGLGGPRLFGRGLQIISKGDFTEVNVPIEVLATA